ARTLITSFPCSVWERTTATLRVAAQHFAHFHHELRAHRAILDRPRTVRRGRGRHARVPPYRRAPRHRLGGRCRYRLHHWPLRSRSPPRLEHRTRTAAPSTR